MCGPRTTCESYRRPRGPRETIKSVRPPPWHSRYSSPGAAGLSSAYFRLVPYHRSSCDDHALSELGAASVRSRVSITRDWSFPGFSWRSRSKVAYESARNYVPFAVRRLRGDPRVPSHAGVDLREGNRFRRKGYRQLSCREID